MGWKESLLVEAVGMYLDDAAEIDKALARVPWKTVSEYIKANDGTYKFGFSVCKKKYKELQGLS